MTSPTLSQAELREGDLAWLRETLADHEGEAGAKDIIARILRLVFSTGGVLVPVEPTMDQLAAGYEAMFDGKWDCSQAPMMGAGYDAMIAAAPLLTKEG